MTETGAMAQTVMPDRSIKVIGEILEEIVDRIVGKGTEMKGMVTITIEIGTDQEKEHLQETIEEIEALAMTDPDQGPELAQIEIECCVTQISYNRIIGVLFWALYISSTHSHLYQRW